MIAPMTAPVRPSLTLLLLAGTAEARQLARALTQAGHRVTAWLTEPPRGSNPMPMAYEMRDAGDAAALRRDMAGFDAVLDLADVQGFATGFLSGGSAADLNGDGVFDLADIQRFIGSFNTGCGF